MQGRRLGYLICLILTIFLVGLHFAVAGSGHTWYNSRPQLSNGVNYQNKNFNQFAAFIIIAALFTLIISIILLIGFFSEKISPKVEHILATLNLMLSFAIAVVIAILASCASNQKDMYDSVYNQSYTDLQTFWQLAIADTVLCFIIELIYLALIFLGTLSQIEKQGNIGHPAIPVVPQSAERYM